MWPVRSSGSDHIGSELGATTEVRVRYAPLTSHEALLSTPLNTAAIDLGPFIFSRAQSVRDRLKKAEEYEREILRGYIIELHKDRPTSETEQSHEVTLEIRFGAYWRQLRIRLLPSQYREAVRWHDQNSQVDIDAVIDKRSKVWSVAELVDLRPVDKKTESSLFEDRPG